MASASTQPSLETPEAREARAQAAIEVANAGSQASTGTGEVPAKDMQADATQEPAAPESSVPDSNSPAKCDGWLAMPRLDFEVAQQFACAASGTTWQRLCRNTTLNPQDIEFTLEQRLELESIVAQHLAIQKHATTKRGLEQLKILQDLRERSELTELTMDVVPESERQAFLKQAKLRYAASHGMVANRRELSLQDIQIPTEQEAAAVRSELWRRAPDFVPDAGEVLLHRGCVYVATKSQMAAAAETRAHLRHVRREFLMATLGWFVSHHFVDMNSLAHLPERFDILVAGELY